MPVHARIAPILMAFHTAVITSFNDWIGCSTAVLIAFHANVAAVFINPHITIDAVFIPFQIPMM